MIDINSEFTDKEINENILQLVIEDSNNWDQMNGRELNKRLTAFKKNNSKENMASVLSCLRLAYVYILKRKDGDTLAIPALEDDGKTVAIAFSTKKHIPKEGYEDCKVSELSFTEFVYNFKDKAEIIGINPFTDAFFLPSDKIAQAIDLMDNIENEVDTLMENGIAKEDLSDLLFERFWGRNLECTLTDGSKIVGAAEAFDYDDTLYFEVKTSNGIVKLHKADVSFIKDLGFDE